MTLNIKPARASATWSAAAVSIACALTLAPVRLEAADGVRVTMKTTDGGATETNQVQIEKDRMRAEMSGGRGGGRQAVIFDGTAQVLRLVDYSRSSYTEMTKADVDQLAGQLSGAMAAMQAQLQNLPPEQRAQVEAMMRARGGAAGGAPPPKTQYRKTGSDKVGKWTCDKYEGYQGAQKVSEVCTVEPKALGFTAADFQVSKQLADFFRKLAPQQADRLFELGSGEDGAFSGVPVRTTTLGAQPVTTEVTDVVRETFPASTYEVPAGFTKDNPFAGRGRGRNQ